MLAGVNAGSTIGRALGLRRALVDRRRVDRVLTEDEDEDRDDREAEGDPDDDSDQAVA
jgi:hypothetical protein